MDGLRAQARARFESSQKFATKPTISSLVTVAKFVNAGTKIERAIIPSSQSRSICNLINKPVTEIDNERAKATLRIIKFERDWEEVICIDKSTFLDVFDDFGFDPYWLHMIQCSTYGFFSQRRRGDSLYTVYLHTVAHTVMWSHDFGTMATKVLYIPRKESQRPEQGYDSFIQTIEYQKDLVDDWRFCSFVCGINLVQRLEETVRDNLDSIRSTEVITRHGIWGSSVLGSSAPTTNELVTHSKKLGLALTALANIFRHGSIAREILNGLASHPPLSLHQPPSMHQPGNIGYTPTADDIASATALLEGQIQSRELQAGYLQERGRTQQSVIFNLLARDDAKRSKDIALAAQKNSHSMKTIAIMTMVFLPPTFFATLFAMPLLKWDGPKVIQPNFGLYWVFSLPTTALVLLIWHWMSSEKLVFAVVWTWIQSKISRKRKNSMENNKGNNVVFEEREVFYTSWNLEDCE